MNEQNPNLRFHDFPQTLMLPNPRIYRSIINNILFELHKMPRLKILPLQNIRDDKPLKSDREIKNNISKY